MTKAMEQALMDAVTKELPEAKVERVFVTKNGTRMAGFALRRDDRELCPTFYFEKLKTAVEREGIETVVKKIAQMNSGEAPFELPVNIRDYDSVKDLLSVSAVNAELWKESLPDMPHRIICDLALICTVTIKSGSDVYNVNITNALAREWGVNGGDILKDAMANAPKVSAPVIGTLGGIMNEISGIEHTETPGVYVMTNKAKINGFASIFYPGAQNVIRAMAGECYILPSSRHEAMIVSTELGEPKELIKIVTAINRAEVSDEDFLSDNVYWFGEDGELKAYR